MLLSNGTPYIAVYSPDGAPQKAWKPTITNSAVTMLEGVNYPLSGTQFNGLSQACGYGDDAQMATNYPIVRVKSNTTGVVSYLRTFNHSTMGVATGPAIVGTTVVAPYNSVQFPGNSFADDFTMVVIANGISSDPVPVSIGIGPARKGPTGGVRPSVKKP